jgi:cell division protein FtsW
MKFAITLLVSCVAALLALGMVTLYSIGMVQKTGAHYVVMQMVWAGVGLVFCVAAACLNYQTLRKLAWPLLGVSVVLLILVFLPYIGVRVNGAHRWIRLGSFQFQSSEFAKIALVIALAWYGERYQRTMSTLKRGIAIPALIIAPVLGLIFIEPDRGSTILLAGVSASILLIAGVRWSYIIPPALAAVAAFAYSIWHDPMRLKRIFSWLYLEDHKSGVGYQAWQAMLALGSGGWFGLGLGNSRQKLGFVPERHTDFILSIIGEELGAVSTLFVVVAFIAIVISGIYIATRSPDRFGFLLGVGLTFLIGFQGFINIGVVTSALPNKGLPLPFVSYGGSNLLAMLACVGLLLSIARRGTAPEPAPEEPEAEESGNPFRARRNMPAAPMTARTALSLSALE